MKIVIELPISSPSWNDVLGTNRWKGKAIKDLTRRLLLLYTQYDASAGTLTIPTSKRHLTELLVAEFLRTTGQIKSKRLGSLKKKAAAKKR